METKASLLRTKLRLIWMCLAARSSKTIKITFTYIYVHIKNMCIYIYMYSLRELISDDTMVNNFQRVRTDRKHGFGCSDGRILLFLNLASTTSTI